MQSTRRRWQRWLKTIQYEVWTLHWNRAMHRRISEIVAANPQINYGNPLHKWMHSNYIAATAIGLRRLIEKPQRGKKYPNLSLQVLLLQIATCPQSISAFNIRRFYRRTEGKSPSSLLLRTQTGTLEVFPEGIKKAISQLEKRCERIERFADKYIAHHDRKRRLPPTLGDIDTAIEAVGDLFNEVSVLPTGKFGTLESNDLGDWEAILRTPWIELQAGQSAEHEQASPEEKPPTVR